MKNYMSEWFAGKSLSNINMCCDELLRDPGADQDVKRNLLFNSKIKAS